MKSNTKTKSLAATLASKNFSKIVTKYTVREGGETHHQEKKQQDLVFSV